MKKILVCLIFAAIVVSSYKKEDDQVCVDCYDTMQQHASHEYFCGSSDAIDKFVKQYQKTDRYICVELKN